MIPNPVLGYHIIQGSIHNHGTMFHLILTSLWIKKRVCNTSWGLIYCPNSFTVPIGRYEWNQQLVTWLFTEPWTLWYQHTRFWSVVSKSNKLQLEIMLHCCLDNIWDLWRWCKTFPLPIVRLEWGGNIVPWLDIEPWIIWYPRTGLGITDSKSS